MNYFYHQTGKESVNERWKPIPEDRLDTVKGSMFVTVLSVDTHVTDDASKEQLADIAYRGPWYADFDSEHAWDTAKSVKSLVDKLVSEYGVKEQDIALYASGGKGFHVLVPQGVFMAKPAPMKFLPAIYKEMSFSLAEEYMDFRVYTARRGRMFRQPNVQRPNGLYKVRITRNELSDICKLDADAAKARYAELCSGPRSDPEHSKGELAVELMALFDSARSKVTKAQKKVAKKKPVKLPENLPSFDALLRGEGVSPEAGFHPIALQVAITAHQLGMTQEALLEAANGLCESHNGDGSRYNSPSKRRAELARMFEYTSENACYEYSGYAVASLLTHNAPDLKGLEVDADELHLDVPEAGSEFDHAGVITTKKGVFSQTEDGPKQISAMSFGRVVEIISTDSNNITTLEADISVSGKPQGKATVSLDTFNSVAKLNSLTMKFGQSFAGNDNQARGMYMRMVEQARKGNNRMYCVDREGLDVISIPFHEDEELRKPFMIWADPTQVTAEPRVTDKINLKFVGFPTERGNFECDLSQAPNLVQYMALDPQNKVRIVNTLKAIMQCQKPGYIGKLLGWMVACHYRMLFHKLYMKFPLLHINGSAGSGKCLAKGTPVLMADGTTAKVENVQVGQYLLSPYGAKQEVLATCTGKEMMYEVTPVKGAPYVVNASHILSLRRSNKGGLTLKSGRVISADCDVLNINVEEFYADEHRLNKMFKGWRNETEIEFHREHEQLPVEPYWLGLWLGDGNSTDVAIYKPRSKITEYLEGYAARLGMQLKEYRKDSSDCSGWAITRGNLTPSERQPNPLREYVLNHQKVKHIPDAYKYGPVEVRKQLLAGLLDTDGHMERGGYDWISKWQSLAEDLAFVCRSLGLAAYVTECQKGIKSTGFVGTYWRVSISGDCSIIPTLDKIAPPRQQIKRVTVTGVRVKPIGEDNYYGFQISGDHLFMLGDFTVTHNSETTQLIAHMHYYLSEPKMMNPSSTNFAIEQVACSSSSIPLIIDEYKPQEMKVDKHSALKQMFRLAYNRADATRGGGTRDNDDWRALGGKAISAPICFIAEASESEVAVMERVVLLTMVKPAHVQAQHYFANFRYARDNKDVLSMIGQYMSASIVRRYSLDELKKEFDPIYEEARMELMLQPGEEHTLSPEEVNAKLNAKERTVYNYAVAKFGLTRIRNLAMGLSDNDPELMGLFDDALAESYTSTEAVRAQTQPEWLKVLNDLSRMTRLDVDNKAYIVKGKDWGISESGGRNCFEIDTEACYYKYRIYCRNAGYNPLFPSASAFAHAMDNLSMTQSKSGTGLLGLTMGVHVIDLDELRAAGFMPPQD